RLAVEVEREVIRREDLAKGYWCFIVWVGAYVAWIHPQSVELAKQILSKWVVADTRDESCRVTVLCGCDCNVRCASSEVLTETGNIFKSDAALKWVDIYAESSYCKNSGLIWHIEVRILSKPRKSSGEGEILAPSQFVLTITCDA